MQAMLEEMFYQIKNNSLGNPAHQQLSTDLGKITPVNLLNPLGHELSQLRTHLLFGVLESVGYNLNRQRKNLKFFEFGTVYSKAQDHYTEHQQLALAVVGKPLAENWLTTQQDHPYYYLKGVIENLLQALGINHYNTEATTLDYLAEGITIKTGHQTLIQLGIPAPNILKAFKIEEALVYAEIHADVLKSAAFNQDVIFKDIPKFPSSRRDFSLLLDDDVYFDQIRSLALKQCKKQLVSVTLFDVYAGKNLPKGKKSYAVSFVFQDANKTLTDAFLDKTMLQLQQALEKELGAELR